MYVKGKSKVYIDTGSEFAFEVFVKTLKNLIVEKFKKGYKNIVFLCIGTDRSTGDSLGPIVGYKLAKEKFSNIFVLGTLDNPVHALNLEGTVKRIKKMIPSPMIIAIDACLGAIENVGYISVGEGAIKPGAAVRKASIEVGDIFITGIVNFGGSLDFITLQNTRLSVVMRMADIIFLGIKHILESDSIIQYKEVNL